MEISQKLLCFLFLASLLAGFIMGIFYDLLTFSRLLLGVSCPSIEATKHNRLASCCHTILLFLEDLIFTLISGGCLMILLYLINDGVFRFWAPLGFGCGFFLYRATIGQLFSAVSTALADLARRLIKGILRCLCIPIRFVCKVLDKLIISPIKKAQWQGYLRRRIKATEISVGDLISSAETAFGAHSPIDKDF